MSATAEKMSFAEFKLLYDRDDTKFEYWGGRAVQKGMATSIHALIQAILCRVLFEAGYKPLPELELRIVPEYHPKPDVVATRAKAKIEQPYPTSALEIVIEILSEDDKMEYVLDKCGHYAAWGFQQVYVVDPTARRVYRWNERGLEIVPELAGVPGTRIWALLDEQL